MKKRIFALFTALLLIASAILLPACKQEEGELNDETSELFNPSLKELFENALKNKFSIDENSELVQKLKELSSYELKDVSGVVSAKATKLTIDDFDISSLGGNITLDGNLYYDAESKRASGDFLLDIMGEKPTFAFTADESGAYITDYLGLNEKPLYIDPEKQIAAEDRERIDRISNALEAYADIYSHIKAAAESVIDSDIEESAFTSVKKQAQLGTSFYTDADEITLTLVGDKAKAVAQKLIDELLKSEDIKALLGDDFDKDGLLSNGENIKELRMINTVFGGETVGFDIGFDAANEQASESYLIKSVLIAGNYMSALGTLGDDGKYERALEFAYGGEKEAGKHGITATVTKDGVSFTALDAKLIDQNGKYDCDITVSGDGITSTNIKLVFEGNREIGNIAVSEVSRIDADGTATTLPIICTIDYKIENEQLTVTSLINAKPNESISVEAESVFTGSFGEVTLEAVSDYMPIEEYDFETAKLQFALKYPKIYTFMLLRGLWK